MKKTYLVFSMLLVMFLFACNNENDVNSEGDSNNAANDGETASNEEADDNLFNSEEIEEGYWIGQSGQRLEAEEMVISDPISYNPQSSYEVNKTCYVTYMNDDEILETRLHDDSIPFEIDTVEEANQIRISFDNSKLENFTLVES